MARNIVVMIILASVLVTTTTISGKEVARKERKGFIHLGSTTKEIVETVDGATSSRNGIWDYWLSANAAGYADAKKDCIANGDHLLEMNTLEERDQVEAFLLSTDQTASAAWVGGKVVEGKWIWESGSAILPQLWGPNEPSHTKPNSRAYAGIVGSIVDLKVQANTYSTRYICEGPLH